MAVYLSAAVCLFVSPSNCLLLSLYVSVSMSGNRWRVVWGFVQAVYEMAVEQKDRVAQGRALWQLGSVLGDQGQFKNAEVPLRDALAILESELGSDHLDIAKACNGMQAVGCAICNIPCASVPT